MPGPVVDVVAGVGSGVGAGAAALPAAVRVVVIGGGIVGCAAALHLSEAGVPVALCEKGHVAGEQSSRNWGWCRQAGRDPRELPLAVESLRLWRGLAARVDGGAGFTASGVVYAAGSEAEEAAFADWLARAGAVDCGARLIRGPALDALMPGASRSFRAGLHVPTDGRAEPQKAAPAIAAAAARRGAAILQSCAVRGIETMAGRVCGVVTERGRIGCEAVILAGGAWSSLFLGALGISLPQLKVHSSVLRTAPAPAGQGPETNGWVGGIGCGIGYRRRADGGFTIAAGTGHVSPIVPDSFRFGRRFLPALLRGTRDIRPRLTGQSWAELRTPRRWALDRTSPFERVRVLDPAPDRRLNRAAMAAFESLYPALAGLPVAEEWAGYIDVTPDALPVIDHAGAIPGLVIATGFSGHGFGVGPAAGTLAAQLAVGEAPLVDPAPFRFSRFSDGSRLTVGADL